MPYSASASDLVSVNTMVGKWIDMPNLTLNISSTGLPTLFLVNVGGTSSRDEKSSVAALRLMIDGTEKARALMSYESNSEVLPASLIHLETLPAGNHAVKVEWSGSARASVADSTRSLVVAEV